MRLDLADHVRREDAASAELESFGVIPHLPWLDAVVQAKFVPLKTGASQSNATPEAYDERSARKAMINEKMKSLKLKRDALKQRPVRPDPKVKRQKITPAPPPPSQSQQQQQRGKR